VTSQSVSVKTYDPTKDPGLDNNPMLHLTRLFVYFLQNLFRDFPEGSGMKWSPDEENTELVVTAEKPVIAAIEKRPHITCVLGAGRWSGLGLDQLQGMNIGTGERTHTDLVPMTMSYHCQAKEGLVARQLAWNASFFTNVLRRILMRTGGLHHVGTQHEFSAESSLTAYVGPTADSELIAVVVTVPFYWQPQWRTRDTRTSIFKKMTTTMNLAKDGGFLRERSTTIRPPTIGGVPVESSPIDNTPALTQIVEDDSYEEEK
jgi:hypothetical protein